MQVIYKWIATSLGVGYLPIAPGTWGSIFGILVLFVLRHFNILSQELIFILVIVFLLLGVLATNKLEAVWGKDPSRVVMDETVGVWITVLFLPFHGLVWLVGLVLFRIFDIWKPFGIRRLESIKGGWGVMLDDVAAGIAGNIVLQLIYFFILKDLL